MTLLADVFSASARFIYASRLTALLVVVALIATGCDSGGPAPVEEEEEPEPIVITPGLTMSSIEVQLNGGDTGLQFFVRADQDLSWRKVTITPPPPFNDIVFNLGDTFVVAEQSVALQDQNQAYTKVNGTWEFVFDVTSGAGNETQGHTVPKTLTVGGSQSVQTDVSTSLLQPLE